MKQKKFLSNTYIEFLSPYNFKNIFCFSAIAKKKSARAIAILTLGCGYISINSINYKNYFKSLKLDKNLLKVIFFIFKKKHINFYIKVNGSGLSSQLEACNLAIFKAVLNFNKIYTTVLKKKKLLTSDYRRKEVRKYGLKKARKAPQYSKR